MPLLQEITNVRQDEPDALRRWFSSEADELYTWTNDDELIAFEFCYSKLVDEHALHWHKGQATSHTRIDNGDNPGGHKRSPIAVADGVINMSAITKRFEYISTDMEPTLRDAVLSTLYLITQRDSPA